MRITPINLVICAGLLAGCESKGPEGDTFFPLAKGKSWQYQITTHYEGGVPSISEMQIDALGSANLDGETAWRRHTDTGVDYWVSADETGIFRVSSRATLDRKRTEDAPRRYVLKQPYQAGNEWETITTSYVLRWRQRTPHRVSSKYPAFPMQQTIEATDVTVTTPAGDFTGCLSVTGMSKIRMWVDAQFGWRNMPITNREWFCPGVGLVKLERTEPSPSRFVVGGTITMELVDWSD